MRIAPSAIPFSLRVAVFAFLILVSLLALRSLPAKQRSPEKQISEAAHNQSVSDTKTDPTQATAKLDELVEQVISRSAFKSARWGVCVISLNDGQLVYSKNGDKLFTPASNMKLYTTAVALDLLGADYRWRTSVYADSAPDSNGTVRGNLILYGRGAPDLVGENDKGNSNSLAELANSLAQRGVKRIAGNVIGDDSYFRGESVGDGWQWNDLQWYFGAEASALSVNDNEVEVTIGPPARSGDPPNVRSTDTSGYIRLVPSIAVVQNGKPFKIGIHRGVSDNEVRVWGDFPLGNKGLGAQLAVHNPALWCARLFVNSLKKHGITVDGVVESRDWRVPQTERFDPSKATELAYVVGQPLGEIARVTNKKSINLNAELILRTLGRERGPMLSESKTERERGDEEAGTELIRLWLARAGISTQGLAFHDGSGLSRLNLVTPESAARLLLAMARTNSGQLFRETLPLASVDGTLQGRLGTLQKRVSAKTGALTYDNSLSGYVVTDGGETLAFSIMCNDQTRPGHSIGVIDEITEIIAQYPTFQAENRRRPARSR